jgi:hypothetical protein
MLPFYYVTGCINIDASIPTLASPPSYCCFVFVLIDSLAVVRAVSLSHRERV